MTDNNTIRYKSGDEQAGYTVTCLPNINRLNLSMWGIWKGEVKDHFKRDIKHCISLLYLKGEWDVLADLTRYTAQADVVLGVITDLMTEARTKKFRRGAVVQKGVIVGMMIGRLAAATGLGEVRYFSSLEPAIRWLDGRR